MPSRIALVLLLLASSANVFAAQSTILESEGNACTGNDRSRRQTEYAALADAKKKAMENAAAYLRTEVPVKDFSLQKDVLSAYAQGEARVIQEVDAIWYRSSASSAAGDSAAILSMTAAFGTTSALIFIL